MILRKVTSKNFGVLGGGGRKVPSTQETSTRFALHINFSSKVKNYSVSLNKQTNLCLWMINLHSWLYQSLD